MSNDCGQNFEIFYHEDGDIKDIKLHPMKEDHMLLSSYQFNKVEEEDDIIYSKNYERRELFQLFLYKNGKKEHLINYVLSYDW